MPRERDDLSKRPERVIILDADDPLTEVHGRFVWQDEHDRVVGEVRTRAFSDGYEAALRDLATARSRSRWSRSMTLSQKIRLAAFILLAVFVLLMLPIVLL
jgi:hypothetical protein